MSSSAVRSVCSDKPLLLGVELRECIEAESAIESVRSKEGSDFETFSWCSMGGGENAAFGLEDRDGGEPPRKMEEEDGEDFRGRGW